MGDTTRVGTFSLVGEIVRVRVRVRVKVAEGCAVSVAVGLGVQVAVAGATNVVGTTVVVLGRIEGSPAGVSVGGGTVVGASASAVGIGSVGVAVGLEAHETARLRQNSTKSERTRLGRFRKWAMILFHTNGI